MIENKAKVTVTDIREERVRQTAKEFGARVVLPQDIYNLDVEIYSPCALGATLNDASLKKLKCRIIAGCANNQLKEERHGDLLKEMGILYAPDYIANAGGTIYDTDRLEGGQVNHARAQQKVSRIYRTMEQIIAIAKKENIPTNGAADRMAEQRIRTMKEVKKYGGDWKPGIWMGKDL